MRRFALALLLVVGTASADELVLRSGGRLSGVVVSRTASSVTLDVGAGRVTLPLSSIDQVNTGSSDLGQYQASAQRLTSDDVAGWLALGRWAADHDLRTQANQAFEHVLALDPGNIAAHQALGHVLQANAWMTSDDANRARGLVLYGSQWMSPQEHAAMLQEQAQRDADARARYEADARAREAEAAAEAASAQASQDNGYSDGVPLWYGGYGAYGGYPYGRGSYMNRARPVRPIAPVPPTAPRPPSRPVSRPAPAPPAAAAPHAAVPARRLN